MSAYQLGARIRKKWQTASSYSANKLIFKAAALIAMLTFGVKIISAAKDIVVAAKFGTSDVMDAFVIAYLLPTFFSSVIASMLNAALIPTYIRTREQQGQDAAQKLFSNILSISILLLIVATSLLALIGPICLTLIAPSFNAEKQAITLHIFYILLPIILISGLSANLSAVLNAGERFALAAITPVAMPFLSVSFLLLAQADWAIYGLSVGVVVGYATEMCLLSIALRRQGVQIIPRWDGFDEQIRQVLKQCLPMLAGGILMNSAAIVDQSMASFLAPGSVSSLGYGSKLVTVIVAITIGALGTAVLPYLSKMVSLSDWQGIRHTLKTYIRIILLGTLPVTALLILFSNLIVKIMFQHGAFTAEDTAVVAHIQIMYALQIPFHTLAILFVRLISAMRVNYILMLGTIISFFVNIVFDYLLMKLMGVSGIALSTTIVYAVNMVFVMLLSFYVLNKQMRPQIAQ